MPRCDFNKVVFFNFIEITLQHGRSPVNLLDIFRTSFRKNTYGVLLLDETFFAQPPTIFAKKDHHRCLIGS